MCGAENLPASHEMDDTARLNAGSPQKVQCHAPLHHQRLHSMHIFVLAFNNREAKQIKVRLEAAVDFTLKEIKQLLYISIVEYETKQKYIQSSAQSCTKMLRKK